MKYRAAGDVICHLRAERARQEIDTLFIAGENRKWTAKRVQRRQDCCVGSAVTIGAERGFDQHCVPNTLRKTAVVTLTPL